MRILFCIVILFTAIQTCAIISIDTIKANLDGRWEWAVTSGGYSGEVYTPQSEHYSLAMVFSKNVPQLNSDSIGYEVYRNDTIILSGFTTLSSNSVQIKAFGPHNLIRGSIIYKSDTLLLQDGFSDGYSTFFVKLQTSRKRDLQLINAIEPNLPSDYSQKQFTLSGRRINTLHCKLPAQILVSRQHAALKGIGKNDFTWK